MKKYMVMKEITNLTIMGVKTDIVKATGSSFIPIFEDKTKAEEFAKYGEYEVIEILLAEKGETNDKTRG